MGGRYGCGGSAGSPGAGGSGGYGGSGGSCSSTTRTNYDGSYTYISGSSGMSGSNGRSGYSGSSGVSGRNGYSGPDGNEGLIGSLTLQFNEDVWRSFFCPAFSGMISSPEDTTADDIFEPGEFMQIQQVCVANCTSTGYLPAGCSNLLEPSKGVVPMENV